MTVGSPSEVRIALLFPELLGTYGDGGNAAVLVSRLRWRSIPVDLSQVRVGDPVPESCDMYLLGGGEDGPQASAARELRAGPVLLRAVDRGAVILAVCAGFQILGHTFAGPGGPENGLGLLDVTTRRGPGPRFVGELVVDPHPDLNLPTLTGYENHACVTDLGSGVKALGQVTAGHGNGGRMPDSSVAPPSAAADIGAVRTEGAWSGRVLGTYLHGPVLARNPALADLMLAWVVGPLDAIEDCDIDRLRAERIAAGLSTGADARLRWRRRRSAAGSEPR